MGSDDSVYLDKPLGMPSGFEPSHSPLPFTGWLMRVLCPVIQVPVLPMSDTGHHHSFCRGIAAQLIGDDHSWTTASVRPQQPAEELHCCESIAPRLHQNIDYDTILIDRSPEVVGDAVDLEEHFIEMPFVTGPATPLPQTGSVQVSELSAPAPDGLIADYHPA